jgi:hypothetical protein
MRPTVARGGNALLPYSTARCVGCRRWQNALRFSVLDCARRTTHLDVYCATDNGIIPSVTSPCGVLREGWTLIIEFPEVAIFFAVPGSPKRNRALRLWNEVGCQVREDVIVKRWRG